MNRHMVFKHDVDVQWFPCSICNYRGKNRNQLSKHIANKHDVAVATPAKKQKWETKVARHLELFDFNRKENMKEVEALELYSRMS